MNKRISRKRAGVSPVIATTIIIAITVALGLGLWAYANTGVTSATLSYADSVKEYGDFTKDRFVISNIDFNNNPSANHIALWIFNSGKQETDFCAYNTNDPARCEDKPSISIVERGGTVPITPSDFCQHMPGDPDPTSCLTRTMPDGNSVKDFRIPPGEIGKFSFDIGTAVNGTATYEITIFSSTGASASIIQRGA